MRIYIGEGDRFRVGQQVEIVYDSKNPRRAALAHGSDIGPVGFPLFFAIVLGLCAAVVGALGVRLCRGATRALRNEGRTLTVDSELVSRGRVRRLELSLTGRNGESARLWSATRRGWSPLLEPVEATVFGSLAPKSVALIVDLQRQAVTAGRIWKKQG